MQNNRLDEQYIGMLKHILENGIEKGDRTGTGTKSVFDYTIRHKMSEGFPLLTSKKVYTKAIIYELIWFLNGETNIKYLIDNNIHIWTGDAYKNFCSKNGETLSREEFIENIKEGGIFSDKWGDLGPIYGSQWRKWKGGTKKGQMGFPDYDVKVDQIQRLINNLKNNPDSRRLVVNAWNVGELDDMVLPPCHYGFQCYTAEMTLQERKEYWTSSIYKSIYYADDFGHEELDEKKVPKRKLSLKWTQRSVDTCLGLPFNLASYGLLLELLAKEVNMVADELIFSGGDCHIYTNHLRKAKEQTRRKTYKLPKLKLNNESFDFKYEDVEILNYKSSEKIDYPLSN